MNYLSNSNCSESLPLFFYSYQFIYQNVLFFTFSNITRQSYLRDHISVKIYNSEICYRLEIKNEDKFFNFTGLLSCQSVEQKKKVFSCKIKNENHKKRRIKGQRGGGLSTKPRRNKTRSPSLLSTCQELYALEMK